VLKPATFPTQQRCASLKKSRKLRKIVLLIMGIMSFFKTIGQEINFYSKPIQKEIIKILGENSETVLHSPVPFEFGFDAGGSSDVYIYNQDLSGNKYLTTDLTGKKQGKNSIGNYELMICHKDTEDWGAELISKLAYHTLESSIESEETMDLGGHFLSEKSEIKALIFNKYAEYKIGNKKYGILLLIGITNDELNWAKDNGGNKLIEKLKEKNVYPITDLKRKSIFEK
jgi:hypothetical protein